MNAVVIIMRTLWLFNTLLKRLPTDEFDNVLATNYHNNNYNNWAIRVSAESYLPLFHRMNYIDRYPFETNLYNSDIMENNSKFLHDSNWWIILHLRNCYYPVKFSHEAMFRCSYTNHYPTCSRSDTDVYKVDISLSLGGRNPVLAKSVTKQAS